MLSSSSFSLRSRLGAAVAALLALAVLAGCSDSEVTSEPDEAGATHVVKSEFGDVTIPVTPRKALGMYTTDVDILATLGIELAKDQPIRGDGYTTFPSFFPQDALEGIKPFANYPDYNYEAILAAQPDFILNGLGYDKKVVKRLPEIAPTYSLNAYDGRNWREHFKETAEALGRVEQYDAWVAKYEARVAEVKKEIGPDAANLVVAPLSWYEGKAAVMCYTGVECSVFADLGLKILPAAQEKDGEGVELSGEQLGQLKELDYAFAIKSPGEAGEKEYAAALEQAGKNALWNDLKVIKDDHLIAYDMEMTFGSPSGQMAFLDLVGEALTNG